MLDSATINSLSVDPVRRVALTGSNDGSASLIYLDPENTDPDLPDEQEEMGDMQDGPLSDPNGKDDDEEEPTKVTPKTVEPTTKPGTTKNPSLNPPKLPPK